MYRLILVPLDGSALAERALHHAADLAQATGARLRLLRTSLVRDRPPAGTTEADLCGDEQAYLDERATWARGRGLAVETILCFADAADAIVDDAREHGADLIVMTTHGRGWLGRLVIGSVATAVLDAATVPVLLIPQRATDHVPPRQGAGA